MTLDAYRTHKVIGVGIGPSTGLSSSAVFLIANKALDAPSLVSTDRVTTPRKRRVQPPAPFV